jgi:hypothetical protein
MNAMLCPLLSVLKLKGYAGTSQRQQGTEQYDGGCSKEVKDAAPGM